MVGETRFWAALLEGLTFRGTRFPNLYVLRNVEAAEQTKYELMDASERVTFENHKFPSGSFVIRGLLMSLITPDVVIINHLTLGLGEPSGG